MMRNVKLIVEGAILLLLVTIDAVARRSRTSSGRARPRPTGRPARARVAAFY
jgi:hypothetical protein